MKNVYVKDFPEYLEREISEVFYLRNVAYSYTDGKKWQDFSLSDVTGLMIGKCWAEYIKPEYFSFCGMVVRVTGRVEMFRDVYGMRLINIKPVLENNYDPYDFRIGLPKEEADKLVGRLGDLISSIHDKCYQELLLKIFTRGKLKKFLELPGDKKEHHVYDGGWLKHTIEVAELSLASLEICGGHSIGEIKINKDLLVAGALLHNVGQLSAVKVTAGGYMLSMRGKLVGHMHDGAIFISCTNNTIKNKVEDLSQLIHIVVSAHNKSEMRPMTMEAIIVAKANAISSSHSAVDTAFLDHDKWCPENAGKSTVYSNYFETELIRPREGEKGNV